MNFLCTQYIKKQKYYQRLAGKAAKPSQRAPAKSVCDGKSNRSFTVPGFCVQTHKNGYTPGTVIRKRLAAAAILIWHGMGFRSALDFRDKWMAVHVTA